MSVLSDVIGAIPYRLALAGGWIDQPFISGLNPTFTGSMVVVGVEPTFRFMERCGLATGTRRAMMKLWKTACPRAIRGHSSKICTPSKIKISPIPPARRT